MITPKGFLLLYCSFLPPPYPQTLFCFLSLAYLIFSRILDNGITIAYALFFLSFINVNMVDNVVHMFYIFATIFVQCVTNCWERVVNISVIIGDLSVSPFYFVNFCFMSFKVGTERSGRITQEEKGGAGWRRKVPEATVNSLGGDWCMEL